MNDNNDRAERFLAKYPMLNRGPMEKVMESMGMPKAKVNKAESLAEIRAARFSSESEMLAYLDKQRSLGERRGL